MGAVFNQGQILPLSKVPKIKLSLFKKKKLMSQICRIMSFAPTLKLRENLAGIICVCVTLFKDRKPTEKIAALAKVKISEIQSLSS